MAPPVKKPDPYADLWVAYAEEAGADRVNNLGKQVRSGQEDPGGEQTMS